jgi:hypothetical protein
MITQSTTHSFHFDSDVLNVMYFDNDDSLYIDDANDNAVQVHGIKADHLISLCRNLFCVKTKIDKSALTKYQWEQLHEIKDAIQKYIETK